MKKTGKSIQTMLLAAAMIVAGAGKALADGRVTVTGATGGEAIPADTAGGTWTTLTGPAITSVQSGALAGAGTIVLTIPAGFEFNPGVEVSVTVTRVGDIKKDAPESYSLPVTVTATTLTLIMAGEGQGNSAGACNLAFENIQVRPTAGSPLASGYITQSGTRSFQDIIHLTGNWGYLREVAGQSVGYTITGPSDAVAGSPVSITIQKVDAFGNPLPESSTENLIFSGFGSTGGFLPTANGSPEGFGSGIPVTFDGNGTATVTLVPYLAQTTVINVTDGTHTAGDGLQITVAPGSASALLVSSPPTEVVYGSSFSLTVDTTDLYGNLSTTDLGSSVNVTLGLPGGTATLQGGTTQDIGTSVGNGMVTFENLQISPAGENYIVTASAEGFISGTSTITITRRELSPGVVVGNKVYDGTTDATIMDRSLAGILGNDDVSLGTSGVATFADKHVGDAKPVTVTGLALTGSAAPNYRLSTTTLNVTANITKRGVTVVATPHTKHYDGTEASAERPQIAIGSLAAGDTCALHQRFTDKAVGQSKDLIPGGSIDDGNGGLNYDLTFVSTNGVIEPAPITVTAVADTRTYDGTTASAGVPIVTGTLAVGDLPNFTQSFDNKNAGTAKTLTPSGFVNDGNSGLNYAVTFVPASGIITPAPITVTAVVDSKTYDGTTSSVAVPLITGLLADGDAPNFTQAFDSKNAGTGIALIPSGLVNDGNGGANYVVTFATATSGSILARPLNITVTGVDRPFDGTTTATVTFLDDRLPGDNLSITYTSATYSDANAGSGKLLQITGISLTGNDAGNYSVNSSITMQASIAPSVSTTSVSSSRTVTVEGEDVTFTATVSPAGNVASQLSGTVQFYANGQPLGSPADLNAGVATLTTSQFNAGSNTVSAVYSGDGNFEGSTSASIVQPVQMNITTVRILSIVANKDGTATVTCQGVPDTSYVTQVTPELNIPTVWENFSTNTSGFIDGKWTVTDDMTQHAARFFRAVKF